MPKYADLRTTVTWERTLEALRKELVKWGVQTWLKPTKESSMKNREVVVHFTKNNVQSSPRCSRFPTPEQNLRAIFGAVQAVRLADQRGIGGLLAEVSKPLAALPGRVEPDPCEVLGVPKGTTDKAVLLAAYHQKAKVTHPDLAGSDEEFKAVQRAAEALGVVGK